MISVIINNIDNYLFYTCYISFYFFLLLTINLMTNTCLIRHPCFLKSLTLRLWTCEFESLNKETKHFYIKTIPKYKAQNDIFDYRNISKKYEV